MHASRIGTMQGEVVALFRGYLANFVRAEVILEDSDVWSIEYSISDNQLDDEDLAIGTDTLLFLAEIEDDFVGTLLERRFYRSVRLFYEAAVEKMISKFPRDVILKDLSIIDPRNRRQGSPSAVIRLCRRFTTFSSKDTVQEFQIYITWHKTVIYPNLIQGRMQQLIISGPQCQKR